MSPNLPSTRSNLENVGKCMRRSLRLTELYITDHVKNTTSASAIMRDKREAIVTEGNFVSKFGVIVQYRTAHIYGIVSVIKPQSSDGRRTWSRALKVPLIASRIPTSALVLRVPSGSEAEAYGEARPTLARNITNQIEHNWEAGEKEDRRRQVPSPPAHGVYA